MILDTLKFSNTDYKIYISKDYSKILFKEDNRKLDKQKNKNKERKVRAEIEKIKDSYKKVGFLPQPILINSKGEIVDGQHRFIAAKELEIPFLFTIYDGLTMHDIIRMNSCGRNWDLEDCIVSYISNENAILSYKYFYNLYSLFNRKEANRNYFGIKTIFTIVFNVNYSNTDNTNTLIKDGLLKITPEMYEHAYRKACWINDCIEYFINLNLQFKGSPDYIIRALAFCYDIDEIDNDKLSATIKYGFSDSQLWRNLNTALNALDIAYYNYCGKKSKSNKTFATLYKQYFSGNSMLFYDNIEQQPRDKNWKGYDKICF